MTLKSIAAAVAIAQLVARVDGLEEVEKEVMLKEIGAFNLSKSDLNTLFQIASNTPMLEFVNYVHSCDENTRREVSALTIVTMRADGELSEREFGAFCMMHELCNLPIMSPEEAHQQLGF